MSEGKSSFQIFFNGNKKAFGADFKSLEYINEMRYISKYLKISFVTFLKTLQLITTKFYRTKINESVCRARYLIFCTVSSSTYEHTFTVT